MIESQVLLQTTVGSEADAQRLAEHAVQQRLAACVHIEPIASVYRWQGQIQRDAEWRLGFKTTAARMPGLVAALSAIHPYELPAFYTLSAQPATPEWAQWVQGECAQGRY
jgi:periplasmic divalent cation tolerance protein